MSYQRDYRLLRAPLVKLLTCPGAFEEAVRVGEEHVRAGEVVVLMWALPWGGGGAGFRDAARPSQSPCRPSPRRSARDPLRLRPVGLRVGQRGGPSHGRIGTMPDGPAGATWLSGRPSRPAARARSGGGRTRRCSRPRRGAAEGAGRRTAALRPALRSGAPASSTWRAVRATWVAQVIVEEKAKPLKHQ